MVPTNPARKKRSDQPHLFLRPPERPAWDQLPPASRDEVRKLLVQLFVAQGVGHVAAAEAEADHE